MVKTQEVAKRGVLDLLICCNSIFVAIELKIDDDTGDHLQDWNGRKIAAAGGVAMVANPQNWDTVYRILHDIAHYGLDKTKITYN